MKPLFAIVLILQLVVSGCTNIIGVTTEGPITEDRTSRSLGEQIDDEAIETKALVNIRKSHPRLEQAHVVAVSYNGVVLLAGQVPNSAARQAAEEAVLKLLQVRSVHNELEIAGNTSWPTRSADAWITSKVKSKMIFNKEVKARKIKVLTENSTVFLMGLVRRKDGNQAAELARNTAGVTRVVKIFEYVD